MTLLQGISERILARYLERRGETAVTTVGRSRSASNSVDITYGSGSGLRRVKVKPDPYFGKDRGKLGDRSLALYRPEGSTYAFEVVSDARTREPGWALRSEADELFYYSIAIPQPEAEAADLLTQPDSIFFAELEVERDELVVIPMQDLRAWFGKVYEEYQARPVVTQDYSAWYRLVPKADVQRAVHSIRTVSPVFGTLWP